MISVPYEVKKALRDGMLRKNYRFVVLNDDGTEDFTIDNNTLVSESVGIDERMCSGDTLKFGLCEGSSLEFQYFNHPNIYGRRVQVFVDVHYGYHYEWVNYIRFTPHGTQKKTVNKNGTFRLRYQSRDTGLIINWTNNGVVDGLYTSGAPTISYDDFGEMVASDYVQITPDDSMAVFTAIIQSQELVESWYSIPMGFFDVKKCSRQASTGIMKVTAYNKLMSEYLDADAKFLIEAMQSDGLDDDMITLETIQENLLQGYEITEHDTVEIVPHMVSGGGNDVITSFTVKLNGSSTQYYINIWMLGGSVSFSPYYYRIKVIHDKYTAKLKKALKEIKENIYSELQTPDTVWSNLNNEGYFLRNTQLGIEFSTGATVQFKYFRADNSASYGHSLDLLTYVASAENPVMYVSFYLPYAVTLSTSPSSGTAHGIWVSDESERLAEGDVVIQGLKTDDIELIEINKTTLQNVTLRDLISANYELHTQFGQLSRITDLFSGVELNQGGLYPAEDLYPANDLYPSGAALSATKAMYSQLWADEGNNRKWRYLIITYKGLDGDGNETDYTLQRTVNADGTDDYNMSDNWLFRNLVWTAEQVGDYADAMVTKMQNNEWFPFEMWCAGLPYLETGDQIEIPLNGEVYKSYILQRQLKGIQNLQDTYINGTLDIF